MFPTTVIQRETLPSVAEDLLFTTEICRQGLPENTHPVNLARIRIIRQMIIWATRDESNAAFWSEQLGRAEHAVDVRGGVG